MRWFIVLAAFFCVVVANAQGGPPQIPEVAIAMKEVAFLVGEWEGEGWMMMGPEKHSSRVSEKIMLKAGGTVLSMEGKGTDMDGKVVHEAFGFFFYDPAAKEYRMRSFLAGGATGEFKATAKSGVITWFREAGPRTMRYTIKLDDKGRWHEVGEMSMPDGKWVQFLDMTLKKVK